jgi:C4-type Zn-finger protein
MGQKKFTLNENANVQKCPKCGNKTAFIAHSEQVAEDGCEVWIVCKCGYDPTEYKCGHRLEEVWGTIDKDTIAMALTVWDDEILEMQSLTPNK